MSADLFANGEDSPVAGPRERALDEWAEGVDHAGGVLPGPMLEHARALAATLDLEETTNRRWGGGGRWIPPGQIMAQSQLYREWREAWGALSKAAGGGDDDPAAELLAALAAPLVGHAKGS